MEEIEFIIYVANQEDSKKFYEHLFILKPCIDVPSIYKNLKLKKVSFFVNLPNDTKIGEIK